MFGYLQIEVENELQSLRAQVDEMSVKYSAAVAERASVDNAKLEEARVRRLVK